MTSPVAEKLLTAEEFALTVDPPGTRTELVRGRVVCMPPAKTGHGRRAYRIGKKLEPFIETHHLGEITGEGGYLIRRDPDTVRAPDVGFVAAARVPAGGISDDEYFEGAPDLAVEVVSPDDRDVDVAEKVRDWLMAGSQRVWEVRPRTRTVTVHRTGAPPRTLREGEALTSDDAAFAVMGFTLAVSAIFE
ncbi:MAG: Uma2 family endonuclease [Dehalococcoidia bacterium]